MIDNNKLLENDIWLQEYSEKIKEIDKYSEENYGKFLENNSLYSFASGHKYFGLHFENDEAIFREWSPNAISIMLVGDFTDWQKRKEYIFSYIGNDVWELRLPAISVQHKDQYSLWISWDGGEGKRIPAYATRVVQDSDTNIFNAQVWKPIEEYHWENIRPAKVKSPLIYEAHVGMSGEDPEVHTYESFRVNMLPYIKQAGYNVVQLMAIQEHPYYGSFGYHVSSFFAPSSRSGTPDELKRLIDDAHGLGLTIIMDIVHSHAVKNEVEGLGNYDGSRHQFFHDGPRGEHPAWDSLCFNYGKPEVVHFLLSNIRYWIEEFKFDGFRFDGVTSMLYLDHGLDKAFTGYGDYYSDNLDLESVLYLRMANKLTHEVCSSTINIAEEMSGLPGLAYPVEDGGVGFDFRMSMGVPDFWIKMIKDREDQDWDMGEIFYQLTSQRDEEKVVSYAESHDQALVGDKTIMFRLADKEIYYSMRKDQPNIVIDRAVALHKLIRLITASTAGGAYLTFMGNEFGHPEWIDFPREGNDWSYEHARRLWSLSEDPELKFHWLKEFDSDMIHLLDREGVVGSDKAVWVTDNNNDKILAFYRGDLLFVFNFNAEQSFDGYPIQVKDDRYKIVLNTDNHHFGGFNRVDDELTYYTIPTPEGANKEIKLYLPSRTALVLKPVR